MAEGKQLRRFVHYVTALGALLIAATAYQLIVTPLLAPPLIAAVPLKQETISAPTDSLAGLFPEDAWQLGVCKRLQTTNGNFMLLFRNWEQTSDDRWKLWPITVVIGRGQNEDALKEPVILEAESGAEIRFTESLDMLSGNAPPIHDGRLNGIVEIKRPSADASRSLMIRTANVGIDNRKVWTTEAIQMLFGDARVIGRDLTLHLANATGTLPSSRHASAVLDRMELIYLDEMVVPLHDGPLWEPSNASTPNITSGAANQPATLSLGCGGRVEYDFALDKLVLRSAVSLVHRVANGMEDRFDCDALEMVLRDPTNRDVPRYTPLDWLNQVTAYGSPATIRAKSFDFGIAAEHIDFKSKTGLLTAAGRTGVEVRRSGIVARLTQLAYQFDPNHPGEIGTLDFYGSGLVKISDPKIPLREARWTERLSLKPQGVMTPDDISAGTASEFGVWIDGNVEASFADGGSFAAASVESALKPVVSHDGIKKRQTLAPKWLKATNNVHLDTKAIAVDTHLLQLEFTEPIQSGRFGAKNANGESKPKSASLMRSWIVQPSANEGISDPVARPRPSVRGDSILAKLQANPDGIQAQDLTVIGSVELSHTINTGGQDLPAKLTGEQLRWKDDGGEDVLQLGSGVNAPARFELGDGYFVGPLIQIWPTDNLIEINHAGEFRMPTAVLPVGLSGGAESIAATTNGDTTPKTVWTKAPHCRWEGAMKFDGRTATLSGGVFIEAELVDRRQPWELSLQGDQLQVTLADEVQLENIETLRTATVQQVALLQSDDRPVMVYANRRAADGVMEAKHVVHAQRLVLMPTTGKLIGLDGPGWYRAWIRSQSKGPLAAGPSLQTDGDSPLTGLHLSYHDRFEGDLTLKNLTFHRGVRVGVRGVDNWDETFDVAQMESLSMGESTLDCDQLRVGVTPEYADASRRIPGMPVPWELEAISGVVFRTRNEKGLAEGTASRAVYASIKDLFNITGAPSEPALFRVTHPNGQPGPTVSLIEATINPRAMTVPHMKLYGATLGELPTTKQNRK